MTFRNHKGEQVTIEPKPLTDEQYEALLKQQEEERQKRLSLLDDKEVKAFLYYYKGVRQSGTGTQFHGLAGNAGKPVYSYDLNLDAYGDAIVIGTDRQRCEDDTFDKVTGIYSLILTDKMKKAYEEGGKKLLISKQF